MVRRADGSGTSFNFTNYLSKVNPDWKRKVGEGTAVNWPVGRRRQGQRGRRGLRPGVLPNSIGYVEYAYAKQNKMSHVLLKNSAGNFVSSRRHLLQGGGRQCGLVEDFLYQVLTDSSRARTPGRSPPGDLHHDAQGAGQARRNATNTLKFLRLGRMRNGDAMATANSTYVPLPAPVKALVHKQWGRHQGRRRQGRRLSTDASIGRDGSLPTRMPADPTALSSLARRRLLRALGRSPTRPARGRRAPLRPGSTSLFGVAGTRRGAC